VGAAVRRRGELPKGGNGGGGASSRVLGFRAAEAVAAGWAARARVRTLNRGSGGS
jgi:hypothetical protein